MVAKNSNIDGVLTLITLIDTVSLLWSCQLCLVAILSVASSSSLQFKCQVVDFAESCGSLMGLFQGEPKQRCFCFVWERGREQVCHMLLRDKKKRSRLRKAAAIFRPFFLKGMLLPMHYRSPAPLYSCVPATLSPPTSLAPDWLLSQAVPLESQWSSAHSQSYESCCFIVSECLGFFCMPHTHTAR